MEPHFFGWSTTPKNAGDNLVFQGFLDLELPSAAGRPLMRSTLIPLRRIFRTCCCLAQDDNFQLAGGCSRCVHPSFSWKKWRISYQLLESMNETVTMRHFFVQNKNRQTQRSPSEKGRFEKRWHFHIDYLAGCFRHVVGCFGNRWLTSGSQRYCFRWFLSFLLNGLR